MSRSVNTISEKIKALFGCTKGAACCEPGEDYQAYLMNNSAGPEELEKQRKADISGLPVFAVALAGGGSKEAVERTMASLEGQTYTRWKVTEAPNRDEYGFIMYMWPGDTLAPDGLFSFAMEAEGRDLIFSDEDRLLGGQRCCPEFKPELSRFTQLSRDMLGSGVAVSRDLFKKAGPLKGDTGDDRYGYNLRCAMMCESPARIPKPLYTSCEQREPGPGSRLAAEENAGKNTWVMPGQWLGSFRVEAMEHHPSTAVIIHNKNSHEPLMRLLGSIDRACGACGAEIYIADRGSTDRRTLSYYDILEKNRAAHVFYGGNICLPRLLNRAAEAADRDIAVFMESWVEALDPNWLSDLCAQAARPGVGAAGPMLIDDQGRLEYTGTVVGIGGWQGTLYKGTENDMSTPRKRCFVNTLRSVSGLSSACMMVPMDAFFNAGCFDESFDFAGFDTEFCLRMRARGLESLYVPGAVMKCHGHLTDIRDAGDRDKLRSYDTMRSMLIRGDPCYSPNFDYALNVPRSAAKPRPAVELNPRYV